MLASMFFVGGTSSLLHPEAVSDRARAVTDRVDETLARVAPSAPVPSGPNTWVRVNAAVQLLAATGLATGTAPRVCGGLLAASLVPTTFAGHPFWEESDPGARTNQKIHFFKNLSMMGGALLAAADTDGKPGVAWRARRATRDARRQAQQLKKTAGLEAKLAARSVG